MNNNGLKYKIEVDAKDAIKNIEKFQKTLKNAFGNNSIKPGLNKMSKEMNTTLNKMSKDISDMSTKMNKELSESTSGISSSLKNELKRMNKMVSTAKNTGKVLGKAILKGLQGALTGMAAIGKVLFKALSGLTSTFLSLGKTFGTAISSGIRMCTNIMRTTGKFLTSVLSSGIKAGLGLVKGAGKLLANTISFSLNSAYKVASSVAGKITGVISKAINQKGSIDMGVDMGDYKSKAYSNLSGDVFMSSMNSLLSAMKATLPKQIGSIFESVVMGLSGSFTKLSNTILLVSQSFTFIKSFGPKILSMIMSLVNSAKPYIQAAMNVVGAYMKLHMNTTFAPLRTVLAQLVTQCKAAGQALVDMGHNTINSLKSTIGIITNTFSNFASSLGITEGAFTNFKNTISNVSKFIETSIKSILNYVQNNFGNVIAFVRDALAELPRIFNIVVEAVKPWISAFDGVFKVLKPFIPALTELLGMVGKIVQILGLWIDKLVKWVGKFTEPIQRFADATKNTINKMTSWVDQKLGTKSRFFDEDAKKEHNAKKRDSYTKEIAALEEEIATLKSMKANKKANPNAKWYNPASWADPDAAFIDSSIKMSEDRIENLKKKLEKLGKEDTEIEVEVKVEEDNIDKKIKEIQNQKIETKPVEFEVDNSSIKDVESKLKNLSTKIPKMNFTGMKSLGPIPESSTKTSDYTANTTNAFDKLRNKAIQTAEAIQNKLNSVDTGVAQEEVEELTNDFEKAKQEFKAAFNIKGNGSFTKGLGDTMEKIGKYSNMLAKIKNPLLTIRTEKAKKALADLTESTKKTKAAYDQFKKAGENLKAVNMDKSASSADKLKASMEKAKASFNLLKASLNTGMKFKGFENATASLARTEQDMEKFKAKIKSIFSTMFNGVKTAAKSGWDKLRSIFTKGASDCEKPVNKLKGILGKLAGAFGLYQLGSVFVEGTKSAVKYDAAISNIQRTLGGASQQLIDFANGNAAAFGLSKEQVASYGNMYAIMVSKFESDATKVAGTSQKLLEAAGTIAAGTGYSVEEVLQALQSGINGSSEAVDQLGLNLKVSNLAAQAGVENWNDLTTEQQQAIIVQEILNQTAATYGDIVDSAASRQAAFTAQLANTKLALGNLGATIWTAIMPVLTKLLAYLEVVFNYAAKVVSSILQLFGVKMNFTGGGALGQQPTEQVADSAVKTPAVKEKTKETEDTVKKETDKQDKISTKGTDNAKKKNDKLSDSYNKVGDSAKDSAKKVKESSDTMKGALAGIDELNVLSFGSAGNDSMGDAADVARDALDNTMDATDDFADIGTGISDAILDGLDAGLSTLPELALAPVDDVAEAITGTLKTLFEPLLAAWEKMSPRLTKAIEAFKEQAKATFKELGNLLGSIWDSGGKEFIQHMAELALAIGTVSFEVGTRLLKSFEGLFKYLDPKANNITQSMIDSLNEAAEVTRDFILGITEHFNNFMDIAGDDILKNFADTFNKAVTACAESWTTFIKTLDGLLDHLDPIANEFTRTMLENVNKAIVAVGDALLAFAELLENIRTNGGQEFINSIGDMVVAIMNFAAKIVGLGAGALKSLFEHLNPETNPASKGCIEAFKNLADSISGALDAIGNALQTAMDNGLQEFFNNIADCVLILMDFAATLGSDMISAITGFINSWAGQAIIEVAARALEFLSYVLKSLLEILNGPLRPAVEAVVAGFLAFQGITKVVSIISSLSGVFSTVIGFITQFGGVISTCVTAAQTFFGVLSSGGGVMSALGSAIGLFSNPVTATIAAIVALGVAFIALYKNCEGFRNLVNSILEPLGDFCNAIKETFTTLIEDVIAVFKDVIDIIVGIFTGDGEKVGQAVASLIKNILELFGNLTQNLIEVGWHLITGLCEGIWNGIKAIPDLLAGVGEFIIDFFKGLFGIHSPSKVFAEIGDFLIQGLAQGVSDPTSVLDNLTSLGTQATELMTNARDSILDVFEGISEKISGKFDNVVNGISKIAGQVKDAFNFEWKLPNIKMPHLSWTTEESSLGFKYPKFDIQWNRNGALVNSPTLLNGTMQGAGEAGAEVIVPLENSTFAKTFATVLGSMLKETLSSEELIGNNANNNTQPTKQDVILKVNERELAKASIDAINNYHKQVGKTLLRV